MSAQLPEKNHTLVDLEEREEKQRQRLFLLLLFMSLLLICVGVLFLRYLQRPAPLPDLLPLPVDISYPPHYLFSIYGVNKPIGVALSPGDDRIYVAEAGGERMVRVFDRDGDPLGSFAPPRTRSGDRSPVYLATDSAGRVFVTDRLQHAVFVYDKEGTYLDTILSPDLTLSEYVSKHMDGLPAGITFAHNVFEPDVYYQKSGEAEQTLPAPGPAGWSPLGIRIDRTGQALLTDVAQDHHTVRAIPVSAVMTNFGQSLDLSEHMFGTYGQGSDQLSFPNTAVTDSQGRTYVTDSNNGRISVWRVSAWDNQGHFLGHFGLGTSDDALNLPRGAAIDSRERLHVVDTVGQDVHVYDVSEPELSFLFAFGRWGLGDGQFDYPNDIAIDATGRLYITDRENNRVQVWSY
jgi:DNA-binding beta-propeller fold protein YncE